jgi:hypothetical protein
MTDVPGSLALWFPLVPRARPICAPLDQRIDQVRAMTCRAKNRTEASAALNLTALIASDTGAGSLAAEMCWRQFETFADRAPLDHDNISLAMEPIINLARLAIRDGDGDRAYRILNEALITATQATTFSLDGNSIDFDRLGTDNTARHAARERLWVALLADGTRALTRAGRWQEALRSVEQNKGVGERLLNGRQTAIIALYANGEFDAATAMIASTTAIDPWEQAVATYLESCCAHANGSRNTQRGMELIEQALQLTFPVEQQLFHVRLGLSILELSRFFEDDQSLLINHLVRIAIQAGDAYAARDLLSVATLQSRISESVERKLVDMLQQSGLALDDAFSFKYQELRIIADAGITKLRKFSIDLRTSKKIA